MKRDKLLRMKRTSKKAKDPKCNKHSFGVWFLNSRNIPVQGCYFCKHTRTRDEFRAEKKPIVLIDNQTHHLDLFW